MEDLTYQGGKRDKEIKTWYFDKGTHPYTALRKLFGKRYHEQIEKIIEKIDEGNVSARGNGPKCKIDEKLIYVDLILVKKGNTIVSTVQLWGTCKRRKALRYGYAGKITTKK